MVPRWLVRTQPLVLNVNSRSRRHQSHRQNRTATECMSIRSKIDRCRSALTKRWPANQVVRCWMERKNQLTTSSIPRTAEPLILTFPEMPSKPLSYGPLRVRMGACQRKGHPVDIRTQGLNELYKASKFIEANDITVKAKVRLSQQKTSSRRRACDCRSLNQDGCHER